jgi:DNA-binding beta-propeller fold protein YncE
MVHWIDANTHAIKANTLVDPRPRALSFSADGRELWVTSEIDGTLMVIDVATKEITQRIKFAVPGLGQEKIQPVGVNVLLLLIWSLYVLLNQ